MGLKVIGAGFGRTGTMSLKRALEELGFVKTHHMEEVLLNRRQVELWHDIAQGNAPDWDSVFEGFQASVDFPSSGFYAELLAHYPEARVVLTVRDADAWYRSAQATIWQVGKVMPRWLKSLVPQVRKGLVMAEALVWERVFHGRFGDEAYAKKLFAQHIEAVQAAVPKEQLLIYEVKQGWAPLCDFLGCEIPSTPFPNVNDTPAFVRRIRVLKLLGWLPLVLVAGVTLLIVRQLLSGG